LVNKISKPLVFFVFLISCEKNEGKEKGKGKKEREKRKGKKEREKRKGKKGKGKKEREGLGWLKRDVGIL
jgi:hypothetical protein